MAEDPYGDYLHVTVYPSLSKFSLISACLVVLIMICISIYDRKLVDRVSLRLQTVISCYDIWIHCFPLWSRPFNKDGSPICDFIGFMYMFGPLIYGFLNVCIGINLQLIFLHGITVTKKIEAAYWIGSFSLALLISLPPFATGKYGWSDLEEVCLIKTEYEHFGKMFSFFAAQFMLAICMLYLIIIVILVVLKLRRSAEVLTMHGLLTEEDTSSATVPIKSLTYRVILYPIVMVMTHSLLVVDSSMYAFAEDTNNIVGYLELIMAGLLGTLNLIAFLCDPTIHHALKTIYYRISNKPQDSLNENNAKDFNDAFEFQTQKSSEYQMEDGKDLNDDKSQESRMKDFLRSL